MKPLLIKLLIGALAALFGIGAFSLAKFSFNEIRDMRQLERVPQTPIASSLPGVVNIRGIVEAQSNLLISRLTQTPSVYYRYRHEVEETDSEGRTSWSTKEDWHKAVDFKLTDNTGGLTLSAKEQSDTDIDWRLPYAKQTISGDDRYTEWRIVPGDRVFSFGILDDDFNQPRLRFDKPGDFTPIISLFDEFEARSSKGGASILWMILAIACLAGLVYCVIWLLKIHRLLVYLTIFSFAVFLCLFHFGLLMMKDDGRIALNYLERQVEGANSKARQLFLTAGLSESYWDENTDFLKSASELLGGIKQSSKSPELTKPLATISSLRETLLDIHERLTRQYGVFPYRQVLWLNAMSIPPLSFEPTPQERKLVAAKQTKLIASRIEGWWTWAVPLGCSLFFALLSWLGLRSIKTKRMIESIPTSPCQGVVYGVTEVAGIVELKADKALSSPLTKTDAVWYHYLVEEKRGSGKNAKWVTVTTEQKHTGFACSDSTGSLDLDPTDAEVITHRKNVETRGNRRYSEQLLCDGDRFYAIGFAKVSPAGDRLVLGKEGEVPFILSNKSEFDIMLGKARVGIALWNAAVICALSAAIILFASRGGLAPTDFMASALLAPLVLFLLMIVLHYNDLVFLKQRAERNLSNIFVSLTKRKDLLPALVDITKAYSLHESNVQAQVTQARGYYQELNLAERAGSDSEEQVNSISRYLKEEGNFLGNLRMVGENYPDLKANQVYRKLMDSLTALENEVGYMRTGFNDAVEVYNGRCESFPDNILVRLFSFSLKKYEHEL